MGYNAEEIAKILGDGISSNASDIFIIPGAPLTYKIDGEQNRVGDSLYPKDTHDIIEGIYDISGRSHLFEISKNIDDDFSFALAGIGRFRLNVYHQRSSLAAVVRIIKFGLPNPDEMGIPEDVMDIADITQGLALVTGPTGCGKSTTLACIIDRINKSRCGHIVTVEDPIEFLHPHKKSLVSQREIPSDVQSYELALASTLREDPDTIMFGEMRTQAVIEVAMQAAETGQFMLSSLHTLGAAATITRIIDAFPAEQQTQARTQLSQSLVAVVSQKLVFSTNGRKRVPVFEIMRVNPAIRNLIRENKIHQIDSVIQTNSSLGMRLFDDDLVRLYREGTISEDTVIENCIDLDGINRKLKA